MSPDEFNRLFNWAQKEYFYDLLEDLQGWDAVKSKRKRPMGNASQVNQKLSPFKVPYTNTVSIIGQFTKPNNLIAIESVRTINDRKRIWRVEPDRLAFHLDSAIDAPTADRPIYVEYSGYLRIYPTDLGNANMDYLRVPEDAKWAYTEVGGRPVYDEPNSLQPIWDDILYPEIVSRMLREFGVSIKDPDLVTYFNSINQNGQ